MESIKLSLAHPCSKPSTRDVLICPTPYVLRDLRIEECKDVRHRWVLMRDEQNYEGQNYGSNSQKLASEDYYPIDEFPTTFVTQPPRTNLFGLTARSQPELSEWMWDLGLFPLDSPGIKLDFRVNIVSRTLSQLVQVKPDPKPIRIVLTHEDIYKVKSFSLLHQP